MESIQAFKKDKRKDVGLTQQVFAEKVGVPLTVIRKIEQDKSGLLLEKVNQVSKMFSHILAPVSLKLFSSDNTNNDEASENVNLQNHI